MFCEKCQIDYDESRKYCRNCGNLLSAHLRISCGDPGLSSLTERRRMIRYCPGCRLHFEVGNYCRMCGASLKGEDILPDRNHIQERRAVKSLFSEWRRLTKWKRQLEFYLGNLEKHRNSHPEDSFALVFQRYSVQMESLSCRLREIEAKLETIKARMFKQVGLLKEDSALLQKRLDEIRSFHCSGSFHWADYSAGKKGIKQQVRSRKKQIKEGKKIIFALSQLLRRESPPPVKARNLIRRPTPAIAVGILILIAAGACFLWANNGKLTHSQGSPRFSKTNPSARDLSPGSSPKIREDEMIMSLFETIRRANLEKKIDLFMSCYAADFKDKSKKRAAILESWNTFDYLGLYYTIKRLTVTAHTAQVRVEWLSNLSPNYGGPPEKTTSVLDVFLKKEDGHWKIEEIKPVI